MAVTQPRPEQPTNQGDSATRSSVSPLAAASAWLCALLAALLAGAVVFLLAQRMIILSDEGLVLMQAVDILKGKVLYRDMDAFVTPGIWYLLAAVFAFVEPSVFAGRMVALVGFVLMVLVCFRIIDRMAPRIYAWATAAGLVVTYVWAFPAWTFPFYSQYAVLFALAALDRMLAWRLRRRVYHLLIAGLFVGMSITFKQNYGAFAVIGLGAALVALQIERGSPIRPALRGAASDWRWVLVGVLAVAVPVIGYFAHAEALAAVWDSLIVHPFTFGGHQNIAYLRLRLGWNPQGPGFSHLTYGAVPWFHVGSPADWWPNPPLRLWWIERLHVLLYWFPPAAFVIALVLVWWPRRHGQPIAGDLACVTFMGSALFLGVFPRADFAHLMNVYQPVILVTILLAQRLIAREQARGSRWWARARILLPLGLVAAYSFTALFWYNRLRIHYNTPLSTVRAQGLLEDPYEARILDDAVSFLQEATRPDEAVLTVPDLVMFNFLADRPVPSRYYNLYEHHIAHDDGAGVVDGAEAHQVTWAVTRYDNFFSDPIPLHWYAPKLWTYLRTHFEIAFTRQDDRILFLRRRPQSMAPSVVTHVLGGCSRPQGRDARQIIQGHMLFSVLSHYPDPNLPFVGTRCTVTIPDQAQLVVGVGYTKPAEVEIGTELAADVWVLSFQGAEHLLHEMIEIAPPSGWKDPRWREYRFDLSRYARDRVTIVFHVAQYGAVETDILSPHGFALEWLDPHIESPGNFVVPGVD